MSALARPVLAGNWKMHHGPSATEAFFREFLVLYPEHPERSVVFFPPALSLAAAREAVAGRGDIRLGVQDVYWAESGAFTGQISAAMARDAGAELALVGHSERRHLFGETIEDTVRKVRAVLDTGLAAMLCVGERIEERRAGRAEAVVFEQLDPVLADVGEQERDRLLIAYEPVWAIGTGVTATPDDARQMHAAIRGRLTAAWGEAAAVPILYGGSVKPENARELLEQPDIDGVLVGGASLKAGDFSEICTATP